MAKTITITGLQDLLKRITSVAMEALTHVGLLSNSQPSMYVDAVDRPSPSSAPLPVHILSESIKKTGPVLKYCDFLEKFQVHEDEDRACVFCLEGFERNHEIRELANCCHMFHRECVDSWVDEGQLTCPLCRSMLFQAKEEKIRSGEDPWMRERIAYLFG